MARLIGCILIAAGSMGLGFWYKQQIVGRLHHIRILISILDMMMSQVRYSKTMLAECCISLADRLEEPYRSTFAGIWEAFGESTGESYGELFRRSMEECLSKVPLGKEEKGLFLEFAASCGYEDAKMQLGSMEQYRERLKVLSEELGREVAEKGRMAVGLGSLGGLLLIIILL